MGDKVLLVASGQAKSARLMRLALESKAAEFKSRFKGSPKHSCLCEGTYSNISVVRSAPGGSTQTDLEKSEVLRE